MNELVESKATNLKRKWRRAREDDPWPRDPRHSVTTSAAVATPGNFVTL